MKRTFVSVLKVCCLTLAHCDENSADEKFVILDGRNFALQRNWVFLQNALCE